MSVKWLYTLLAIIVLTGSPAYAAKPVTAPAAVAAEVHSVLLNQAMNEIEVHGVNLDSVSGGTLAGVDLTLVEATQALVRFSIDGNVADQVTQAGNFILKLVTDSGTSDTSVYIPYALFISPPSTEPCPCYSEWEQFRTSAPPQGFDGVDLTCYIDDPTYTYVYFDDAANGLGWILRTEWIDDIGLGYCEAFLDGPQRILYSQTTFTACSNYLKNQIIVLYSSAPTCQ